MRRMVLEGRTGTCEIAVGDGGRSSSSADRRSWSSILHSKGSAVLHSLGASKLVIVTDETVRRLHGARFPDAPVVEIGQGEASKTLTTVASLYERFLELELDRSSFVLAIGGGIVCDVAAFAASTWMRGIPFGLVPTTLIAQADAGIGGKNGVNLREYKNLVGVFRQPSFCLCDSSFLATLPDRELRCGLAEVIKHGAIAERALFEFVEEQAPALLGRDRDALDRVVSDSLQIKTAVVAADETEQGERRKLNFGHTLGHALERIAGLPHGEAVSVGMVLAARLSVHRGMLESKEADRLEALLRRVGLPTSASLDTAAVMDAVRRDKKRQGERIHMALLAELGRAEIVEVGFDEIERSLR